MTYCSAVIVAGGSGSRFSTDKPKQYMDLVGIPILRRSVMAFQNHPLIDDVLVVIDPKHKAMYDDAVAGLNLPEPAHAGASRQGSVRNGLEALAARSIQSDFVMIHDAARPLIDSHTITAAWRALQNNPAIIVARPVVDTLKKVENEQIVSTIDRTNMYQAQTPQCFHFNQIMAAHRTFVDESLTDDAALAERAGIPVTIVVGNTDNMKLTLPYDMERAAMFLRGLPDVRVGYGCDVHRFNEGNHIFLCGVKIPHTKGIEAHSDGDVALHALTDAVLGAMGAGDIGKFFPPSDPEWKGKPSAHFLRHAADLARKNCATINHVDVTIICEKPKIGPHREAMQECLAEILGISPVRASVKATTFEKLGFTGKEEGIEARATATLIFG